MEGKVWWTHTGCAAVSLGMSLPCAPGQFTAARGNTQALPFWAGCFLTAVLTASDLPSVPH